jgi:hypothetical protein
MGEENIQWLGTVARELIRFGEGELLSHRFTPSRRTWDDPEQRKRESAAILTESRGVSESVSGIRLL